MKSIFEFFPLLTPHTRLFCAWAKCQINLNMEAENKNKEREKQQIIKKRGEREGIGKKKKLALSPKWQFSIKISEEKT